MRPETPEVISRQITTGTTSHNSRRQTTADCFTLRATQPSATSPTQQPPFDTNHLGVMSGEVGQSGDRRVTTDGGVGSVVIVEVEPAGQGLVAVLG